MNFIAIKNPTKTYAVGPLPTSNRFMFHTPKVVENLLAVTYGSVAIPKGATGFIPLTLPLNRTITPEQTKLLNSSVGSHRLFLRKLLELSADATKQVTVYLCPVGGKTIVCLLVCPVDVASDIRNVLLEASLSGTASVKEI